MIVDMRNPWKDNERKKKKKNEGTNGKAAQGKIFLNGGIQKWYEIPEPKLLLLLTVWKLQVAYTI